jgi:hypothetical protein
VLLYFTIIVYRRRERVENELGPVMGPPETPLPTGCSNRHLRLGWILDVILDEPT